MNSLPVTIASKIEKSGECWLWSASWRGGKDGQSYGAVWYRGVRLRFQLLAQTRQRLLFPYLVMIFVDDGFEHGGNMQDVVTVEAVPSYHATEKP